jgi:hypothetical protein
VDANSGWSRREMNAAAGQYRNAITSGHTQSINQEILIRETNPAIPRYGTDFCVHRNSTKLRQNNNSYRVVVLVLLRFPFPRTL